MALYASCTEAGKKDSIRCSDSGLHIAVIYSYNYMICMMGGGGGGGRYYYTEECVYH